MPGLKNFAGAESHLTEFLRNQAEFRCAVEIEGGFWAIFAVAIDAGKEQQLAAQILSGATFPYEIGTSEDERWTLFYVATVHKEEAIYWLQDLERQLAGELRPPTPTQLTIMTSLAESPMPHRGAQSLAEAHDRGDLAAGSICDPKLVRAVLDRLHMREPLFYSAVLLLLRHNLIDLIVLLAQIIPEDIELANDSIRGSLSRDPFLRARQTAAADIRQLLVRFHVINAIDQQKSTAIENPYRAFLELPVRGDQVSLSVDGLQAHTRAATFTHAIKCMRRNVYSGVDIARTDTNAPWISGEIAHTFRFVRQSLERRSEFSPLDQLFMWERAVF
jgi:hypothetical protein